MDVNTSLRLLLNSSLLFYKLKLWKDSTIFKIPLKNYSLFEISGSGCSLWIPDIVTGIEASMASKKLAFRISLKKDYTTTFSSSPFNKQKCINLDSDIIEISEDIIMKEPTKQEFERVSEILENYEFSASILNDDSLIKTIELFLNFNSGFIMRMFYFTLLNDFKTLNSEIVEELNQIMFEVLGDAAY